MAPTTVRRAAGALFVLLAVSTVPSAGRDRLELHRTSLELPGAAVDLLPTDLDGDGIGDLAIFVVGTRWGEKVTWDESEMDGVEGLVEVMTVVSTLLDRRELWLYRGDGVGGLERWGPAVPVPKSVHALSPGPAGHPVLALTDEGLASVRTGEGELSFELLVEEPPLLAETETYLPGLELLVDLDGDERPDLLLPTTEGVSVYLGGPGGFEARPVARNLAPGLEPAGPRGGPTTDHPLPEVRDVTGDGRPDLVWRHPRHGWRRPWVVENRGEGRFTPPRALFERTEDRASEVGSGDGDGKETSDGASQEADGEEADEEDRDDTSRDGDAGEDGETAPEGLVGQVLAFADLDGEGRAEVATVREDPEPEDLGMRKSIDWAESPPGTLRIYETTPDLEPSPSPRTTVRIEGYAGAGGGSEIRLPGGFRDLDGDGRQDLITLSLGISITRLLGGLALGRVTLPMDFHLWCQESEGLFRRVEGLDLSGRFRVDIKNLEVRDLPSFEGDFDGDGRFDFVQLGRGREITVHRGAPGCRFPSRPDLEISLRAEPAHMALVRVEDLDGDGRSDLVVTHPLEGEEPGMVPPTRLDVYLSGKGTPR